jgi:hypothetical protein
LTGRSFGDEDPPETRPDDFVWELAKKAFENCQKWPKKEKQAHFSHETSAPKR